MAFTNDTLDFLVENLIVNSRDWFNEHKPRYKAVVEGPMLALSEALAPTLANIDPGMTLVPRRTLSRIWKDMRYYKDGAIFRDVMWLVFRRGKGMEYPAYFFEFSPRGFRYGLGYYAGPGGVMGRIREWVLTDDRRYLAAKQALDALPQFQLEGDRFKRSRYPDAPEEKRDWLERKNLVAIYRAPDMTSFFSEALHLELAAAFQALAPMYAMLLDAHLESLPPQPGDEP